jgi:aryl carrier-like protein
MENQPSQSKLKGICIALAILLIGSLIYNFQLRSETSVQKTELSKINVEKTAIYKDLEEVKATYDALLAEKTTLSDELEAERQKVIQLMEDLKKSKSDVKSLIKYKHDCDEMERKLKSILQEVDVLKKQNNLLTTNLDSTKIVLEASKKVNDELKSTNDEMTKTIEKASKLVVTNLNITAFKQKSSGKQIVTDKARRVDGLKIKFTVAENSVAKSGEKLYYVQVIDAANNIIGAKETVKFEGNTLTYSFTTTVKYDNKTVDISQDLLGKDFVKGSYFVNIYDKGELVSKSEFNLR